MMQATTLDMNTMQGTLKDTTQVLSEDDRLVLAAKADRAHFGRLYDKYYEGVVKFIYKRCSSKDEAFDIAQQTFLQAMIALDKYESRGFPFSSWLYRIALNELNTRFRKNKGQRTVNIDDTSLGDVMTELEENPSEQNESKLLLAMQDLEEDEMALLEMRFFEKRQFKEIAEIKDSNESAVKMKVYRLLEKLKTMIDKK